MLLNFIHCADAYRAISSSIQDSDAIVYYLGKSSGNSHVSFFSVLSLFFVLLHDNKICYGISLAL